MDYEAIKALAKERGISPMQLIAMSGNHDPFYMGKPAERVAARWFGALFRHFGFTQGVHLRRIHYRLVSQPEPVRLWFKGTPYGNNLNSWSNLVVASSYARWLGEVGLHAL